jgi:hypothetical protein
MDLREIDLVGGGGGVDSVESGWRPVEGFGGSLLEFKVGKLLERLTSFRLKDYRKRNKSSL